MWLLWLLVATAFSIAEIIYSKFFLIWFSIGAFASLVTSLITSNFLIQLVVFILTSFILFITLTKYFTEKFSNKDIIFTDIDALIGQDGIVLKSIGESVNEIGQVKLDGEIWSAITLDGACIKKGSTVTVEEIRGLRLIVRKKESLSDS